MQDGGRISKNVNNFRKYEAVLTKYKQSPLAQTNANP